MRASSSPSRADVSLSSLGRAGLGPSVGSGGSIWSFVVPHPPLLPGFTELAPYNVVLVALDDDADIRMIGNLVVAPGRPPNEVDPASILIGEPVRAVFSVIGGAVVLQWVRDSS